MPKVSIIIPVYNVEKYLRECLDSVVNQTLRDIEIICVNDGSPDGSPQILEEYAAKDSRITVIHKENGGLSSARNAAYPYIKGEYTLFVDSDDWIELDLCEKTIAVADKEQADMILFYYGRTPGDNFLCRLEQFIKNHSFSDVNLHLLLGHLNAWSKLWRSHFIQEYNIKFPIGICYEDIEPHWKALIQLPKIAIAPEKLYWYRINPESIMLNQQKFNSKDIIEVFNRIKKLLIEKNLYKEEWKNLYLNKKLYMFFMFYRFFTGACYKNTFIDLIKESLDEDDHRFLQSPNELPWIIKQFYHSLGGSKISTVKYASYLILSKTKQAIIKQVKLIQQKLRRAG